MHTLDINETACLVCKAVKQFEQRGWATATSTNASFKPEDMHPQCVYITRSGIDKAEIKPEDFIQINLNGEVTDGSKHKVSAETLLHTLVYKLYPKTEAVLHTHSVYATLLSRAAVKMQFNALHISGYELAKGIASITSHEETVVIPVIENSQDIAALVDFVAVRITENANIPAFMLSGHGLYAWGNSVADAKRHIEAIEFLLECSYKEMVLGK